MGQEGGRHRGGTRGHRESRTPQKSSPAVALRKESKNYLPVLVGSHLPAMHVDLRGETDHGEHPAGQTRAALMDLCLQVHFIKLHFVLLIWIAPRVQQANQHSGAVVLIQEGKIGFNWGGTELWPPTASWIPCPLHCWPAGSLQSSPSELLHFAPITALYGIKPSAAIAWMKVLINGASTSTLHPLV